MVPTVSRLGALAQLFRIKPVMSWGAAAFLLGTAVAYGQVGASINLGHGVLAIVLVMLAQGFVSHGLNDAYDWVTGTDKESIGKGTGGSRVIPENKMSVAGTVSAACVALLGVLAIGAYFVWQYGTPMVALIAIAVWSPVAYSVPPLKLGYRPFSEITVVLPALVGVVVGTDLVLSGSVSAVAIGTGLVHAMFCIAWFIISRIPDYEPDLRVGKVTTVVYLGRRDAPSLSFAYVCLGVGVAVVMAYHVSLAFALTPAFAAGMAKTFYQMDAFDPDSASAARMINMRLTTAHATALSIALVTWGAW